MKTFLEKTLLAVLFGLCFIGSGFTSEVPIRKANSSEVSPAIKVGWYQSDRFQEGTSEDEDKSGYSYEYLQKVSDYNGWEYDYVYGDWSDLLPKLEDGEIDALAGVSITEERKDKMLFPNYAMGSENYVIYQHDDNHVLSINDLSTFDGKKIGGVKDNLMTTYLEQWIEDNNVGCEIVYYSGFTQRDQDFEDGKLDAVVATDNNVLSNSGYSPVVKVGTENYYLAVSNSKPDLLAQLNDALALIQEMEPYFLQNLQYSCYGNTATNASLTEPEKTWVNTHDTLKMGYMDNYLPFCSTSDDGSVTGLITDVMDEALKQLNVTDSLKLEYQAYENYDDMIAALRDGTIDSAFPVGGSVSNIDKDGINATSAVVTTGMDLVYKNEYTAEKTEVIAVNKNNRLQYYYTINQYPDAEIVFYDSMTKCLDAVRKEEVGSTILNGLRIDLVNSSSTYSSLSMLQLQDNDKRYIGVRKSDPTLLLLLNRGLMLIGQNYGSNVAYNYIDELYSFSLIDFLLKHWFSSLILILIIFALVISLILLNLYITRKNQEKLKVQLKRNESLTEEKEKQLLQIQRLSEEQKEKDEIHHQEMEKALLEAENANNAKTNFLFNMSHDIRTPMNAIMGFTALLKKYQEDPDKREDYLKKIEDSSKILLSIINNVLEMARIEKGNMKLEETAVSFSEFIESLKTVISEMMKQKNIEFVYQSNVVHDSVYCDCVKIREIYLNILSNAYKYTEAGGKVTMSVEEKQSDKEGYVLYQTTVSDNGIGMSEEYLPHIFEAFSRESNTTANKIEGTGLGMSIVKNMVEFLGGTIEVTSQKGIGSSFVIVIPLRLAEITDIVKEEKPSEKLNDFSGKRILLAEDNELNAEIAMDILSEYGFKIEHAKDGKVCLDMVKEHEAGYYDLILMDVQMPNMNGYEATRAIRSLEDKEKSRIPIVAMTANAFAEDRKAAYEAGMNGHVAKPIDVSLLTKELHSVIK